MIIYYKPKQRIQRRQSLSIRIHLNRTLDYQLSNILDKYSLCMYSFLKKILHINYQLQYPIQLNHDNQLVF
jgi:hypothetical protein